MIYELEKLDIEKRLSIYSKCIFIATNKGYKKDIIYNLEGIDFSYDDVVNICHQVISVYGNSNEKKKYNILYDNKDITIDEDYCNKLYYEKLRLIYEIRLKYRNNDVMLKKMAKLFKFNVSDINKLCYEYVVDYLKYDRLEYEWFTYLERINGENTKINMSFAMLLDLLRKFDDKEDIIYIIDYSGIQIVKSIYSRIEIYVKLHCKDKSTDEKEQIVKELRDKLDLYMNAKNNGNNKINIDKEQIIRDFIDSDFCYVSDYCKSMGFKSSKFDTYLNYVKKNNKKLYSLYLIKINKAIFSGHNDSEIYIYKMISYWIINGFNGRKLDLLDLFSIPNFDLNKLHNFAVYSTNRDDYKKINDFVNKSYHLLSSLRLCSNYSVNDITKNMLNEFFAKYNINSILYGIAIERLNNGIKLDDLVINMFNYFDKENKKMIRRKDYDKEN